MPRCASQSSLPSVRTTHRRHCRFCLPITRMARARGSVVSRRQDLPRGGGEFWALVSGAGGRRGASLAWRPAEKVGGDRRRVGGRVGGQQHGRAGWLAEVEVLGQVAELWQGL